MLLYRLYKDNSRMPLVFPVAGLQESAALPAPVQVEPSAALAAAPDSTAPAAATAALQQLPGSLGEALTVLQADTSLQVSQRSPQARAALRQPALMRTSAKSNGTSSQHCDLVLACLLANCEICCLFVAYADSQAKLQQLLGPDLLTAFLAVRSYEAAHQTAVDKLLLRY